LLSDSDTCACGGRSQYLVPATVRDALAELDRRREPPAAIDIHYLPGGCPLCGDAA
jgi:hypothetical protein